MSFHYGFFLEICIKMEKCLCVKSGKNWQKVTHACSTRDCIENGFSESIFHKKYLKFWIKSPQNVTIQMLTNKLSISEKPIKKR